MGQQMGVAGVRSEEFTKVPHTLRCSSFLDPESLRFVIVVVFWAQGGYMVVSGSGGEARGKGIHVSSPGEAVEVATCRQVRDFAKCRKTHEVTRCRCTIVMVGGTGSGHGRCVEV